MANTNRLIIIIVGGFLFVLDRLLKYISFFVEPENHLLNRFIGWSPTHNSGIAFGLPISPIIIIILSLILLSALLTIYIKNNNLLLRTGIFFLILGAFSNLFDRIIYGQVIDYLFFVISLFNLADLLIITGAIVSYFAFTQLKTNK